MGTTVLLLYFRFQKIDCLGSSNDRGFSINSETGAISVSRNLDRETQSRIVLTVMAKNAGGIRGNDTDEAQVIVTVQDGNDPPEFLQNVYNSEISEAAVPGKFSLCLFVSTHCVTDNTQQEPK